jgi:acyl carrier protein
MVQKEMPNVEEDIRELVATILEIGKEAVTEDAHFVKDLGMDSMMALEILASVEKKYKIIVPEDSLPKFTNLRATADIVKKLLNRK